MDSPGVSEAEYGVFQVALRTAGYSPHGGWPVEHLVGGEQLRPVFRVNAGGVGSGVNEEWDGVPDVQSGYLYVCADVRASILEVSGDHSMSTGVRR